MMGPAAVHRYLGTEHSISSFETQSCDNHEHTDHTLFHNFVNIDLKPENASIDGIHKISLLHVPVSQSQVCFGLLVRDFSLLDHS